MQYNVLTVIIIEYVSQCRHISQLSYVRSIKAINNVDCMLMFRRTTSVFALKLGESSYLCTLRSTYTTMLGTAAITLKY